MIAHPRCVEFLEAVNVEIEKLREMGAGAVVPGGQRGVPLTEKILRVSFNYKSK